MIIFDHVRFSYGARIVLAGLSFAVDSGERVAITGAAGKARLLY